MTKSIITNKANSKYPQNESKGSKEKGGILGNSLENKSNSFIHSF